MNIHDFLLTASVFTFIGAFLGYFLRDLVKLITRLYSQKLQRSRYFEPDTSFTKNKTLK
jgi:hypothetical protein